MAHSGGSMYEPFAAAFESHAQDSAYNAHYDRPAMLDLMGEVRGLQVLDVGCGPGFYAEELARRGASVIAFDASPSMVELARQRVGSGAQVRSWDVEQPLMWLADDQVDVAVMALVLHHVSDRALVLSELHRVLRSGGRLVLSTTHPTADWMLNGGSYFQREWVEETWNTDWRVRYVRQPLESWFQEFTEAGFLVERLVEPRPADTMATSFPDDHERLLRAPGFIAFSLRKP